MRPKFGAVISCLKFGLYNIFNRLLFARWYVLKSTLNCDFKIELVDQLAIKHYKIFYSKLQTHNNPLITQIPSNTQPLNLIHHFKIKYSRDLTNWNKTPHWVLLLDSLSFILLIVKCVLKVIKFAYCVNLKQIVIILFITKLFL